METSIFFHLAMLYGLGVLLGFFATLYATAFNWETAGPEAARRAFWKGFGITLIWPLALAGALTWAVGSFIALLLGLDKETRERRRSKRNNRVEWWH